jgi:hypothetical protein
MDERQAKFNKGVYWCLILLGGAAIVYVIVGLVIRVIEILPNSRVPVTVPLHETALLPVGPGGSRVAVAVTEGVVHVSHMAGITLVSLVLSALVTAGMIVAITVFLGLFCFNMSRGRVFVRGNVKILFGAAVTLIAGWLLGTLFTTMGVNGAFAALSDHGYDNVIFGVDYAPAIAAIAVCLVGVAFEAGLRLQRDTEGLV